MRRDRYHNNLRKERLVMGVSAVFVLAALTMTGVYVKNKGTEELNDGYQVDYGALEPSKEEIESLFPTFPEESQEEANVGSQFEFDLSMDDALDYAPEFEESDTLQIVVGGYDSQDGDTLEDEAAMAADSRNKINKETTESPKEDMAQVNSPEVVLPKEQEQASNEIPEEIPTVTVSSLHLGEALSWPISGNVLISYSMDKTVYFATLQQYKYSAGMVIAAPVGEAITSASAGTIAMVGEDAEIGKYVVVDMGNGFQATYGQLQNIAVGTGGVVEVGSILGYVAEPTKYYSVEGPNAYFALKKDGVAVDPLAPLW